MDSKERKISKEQQWLAYVAKLRNEHDEEITRLKAELERERELRKEAVEWIDELPYQVDLPYTYFGSLYHERCESLIKKAKN